MLVMYSSFVLTSLPIEQGIEKGFEYFVYLWALGDCIEEFISIVSISILWNHTYSWGPMFVDCQNLAGSWNAISWVTALLVYNTRQVIPLLNFHGAVNSFVSLKVTPRNPQTLNPHEQWRFHSTRDCNRLRMLRTQSSEVFFFNWS